MRKLAVAKDNEIQDASNTNIESEKVKASGLKAVTQKSIIYILGNLVERASQLLLIPLYTRLLTTSDYGFYGAAVAICGVVVPLVDFGITSSLERFIHEYFGNPNRLLGYLKYSFWLRILTSLLSSLVCGLLLFVFWNQLFENKSVDAVNILWIVLFGVGNTLTDFVCTYLRNTSQAIRFVIVRVGQVVLQTIITIYFLFFVSKTATFVLSAQALGATLTGIIAMAVFYIRKLLKTKDLVIDKNDWKYNFEFGIPLIPHQVGNWLRNASDRVILGRFVSLAEVGLYQLSVSVGNIMSIFVACVDLAYIPMFYRIRTTQGKAAIEVLRSFNTCYLIIMGFLTLGISLFSSEIISILAPHKYAYAAQMTPLIVYAIYFQGQYTLVVKPLFFHKKTKIVPLLTLLPGVIGVFSNIVFLPIWGLMTVVWVNLAIYFITFVAVYIVSARLEGVGYPVRVGIITNFIAGAVAVYLTYNSVTPWSLKQMCIKAIIIVVLLIVGWFTFLRREMGYLKKNLDLK